MDSLNFQGERGLDRAHHHIHSHSPTKAGVPFGWAGGRKGKRAVPDESRHLGPKWHDRFLPLGHPP